MAIGEVADLHKSATPARLLIIQAHVRHCCLHNNMANFNLAALLNMPTAMKPAILVDGFRRGRRVVSVPQHDDRSSDADFTAAVRSECRFGFQIDNLSKSMPSVDSSTVTFVYQRRHRHTETTYQ